ACVIITSPQSFEYYAPTDPYTADLADDIADAMTRLQRMEAMAVAGVSATDAQAIMALDTAYQRHAVGGSGGYVMQMAVVVLMFLSLSLYGQMMASTTAQEKGSRTMEVLATSVSPMQLLCGKVAGVALAALSQLAVFLAAVTGVVLATSGENGIISAAVSGVTAWDVAATATYFLLGFVLYSFVYAALGSMVSSIEELSGITGLPTFLLAAGYIIALVAPSGGAMQRAASYIPFWSPIAMPSRMAVGEVDGAETAASLVLLALFALLTAWCSSRLYRQGQLRYGKPPRLASALKGLFAKK
ncbi:MAG: ABC transporter permease, partial [Clostridia bacterium]|nr:ABC transporter permease [Clostridia bacterium]